MLFRSLQRSASQCLKLADHLARNVAVSFFEPLGDWVSSGPADTNVNDIRAMMVWWAWLSLRA